MAVTASTGIAATHIGGTTIHSWSGLGIRDSLSEHDQVWLASNDKLRKRYLSTDVLVIDEVSMLHGARLDIWSTRRPSFCAAPTSRLVVCRLFWWAIYSSCPLSPGREIFDFAHLNTLGRSWPHYLLFNRAAPADIGRSAAATAERHAQRRF